MADVNRKEELVVEAVGLTKIFKDFWNRPKARAVNGLDLQIRKGEVFGLLGPNGSGKSTTIKMILGLLYPTRGELKVFGQDPQNVSMKSRIGYLPEETYLYKYLTAFETLDFYGALFGLEADQRKERASQLLEMVGLAHAVDRPVGEFSKGMARRIGLAQALVNDPDLVILDEPTSGLDPIGCREVKDVIRLLASRGKTVILCSHLLADVQDVCQRVVVLYGGQIRAQGLLEDILRQEDKTQIVTPRLSEQTLKELQDFLQAHGVKDPSCIQVDHPGMDLESYFLDVVRKATEQKLSTAGAHAPGAMPEYLRKDAPASGQEILQALQGREEEEKRRAEAARAEAQLRAAAQAKEEAKRQKLEELTAQEQPSEDEQAKADAQAKAEADAQAREELNKKLSNLKLK